MNTSTQPLTIGRLAKRAGVGIDTVRFYERARLRFIRRAKALGFSLEEISELLTLSAARGGRASVKALAERRLRDLDAKIRELTVMRDTLKHYTHRCSGSGPLAGCPIIEAVLARDVPTLEKPS